MGIEDVHRNAGERGFTTRSFATGNSVTSATFNRHVRSIGWENYHRGLWVPTGRTLTYHDRIAAALEVIGGKVRLTGATGLWLLGTITEEPADVEILLEPGRHVMPRQGVCLHRTTTFSKVRYRRLDDLQVALVPRLIADHAQHTDFDTLCQVIATALRLRQCTLNQVAAELDRRKRFPGRAILRLAVATLRGEVNHSGTEREAKQLLRADGLRFHAKPLAVEHKGRLLAELDISWPDILYAVEADGPHHLLAPVAAADRQRDRELERIHWRIDRFFWFEIEQRPDWFVSQVRAAVEERSAQRQK